MQAGADTVVTLSVNPIFSASGGGAVHAEAAELNEGKPIIHVRIEHSHLHAGLIQAYADRVRRAFDWLSREAQSSAYVLFTVHSQPIGEQNEACFLGGQLDRAYLSGFLLSYFNNLPVFRHKNFVFQLVFPYIIPDFFTF